MMETTSPASPRQTSGNGQYHSQDTNGQPPAFNDDLGHDYGADPNPPPREQGPERFMSLVMIRHRLPAARSLPCKTSPNLQRRIPLLQKRFTTALNTPTEHNGGPPRVSKAKASEFISRAFDK